MNLKKGILSILGIHQLLTLSCDVSAASAASTAINAIELIGRKTVASNTMTFVFRRPPGFAFKAGQWVDFTLIEPRETDAEGNTRGFSIASPPYDTENLMVATRMRDTAFKRTLRDLPLGTELKYEGPGGSFTLHHKAATPAVFVAGGIGITPVRSMVLQAAKDKLEQRIFLFYANNKPEDAAFLDELIALEHENPRYKFVGIMTHMEGSTREWGGEVGHITSAVLSKYIDDLKAPIYYISGPAAMVRAVRETLSSIDIDDDNIRTEEFSGY